MARSGGPGARSKVRLDLDHDALTGRTAERTVRPVLLRLGKWLVVLSLVGMIGGHWALLQSAAWVRMTAKFSKHEPVAVALEKTFSGKFPCQLCKLVKEGKATEKKQDLQKLEAKFEFTADAGSRWFFPPRPIRHFIPESKPIVWLSQTPPTPPPEPA